jgi:hypothetical protein
MAVQKIYVDYDFNKNQILNAKLQPVTTAERNALASGYNSSDAGLVVYDTTQHLLYAWDGNQWDQVSVSDSQIAQLAEVYNKTVVAVDVTSDSQNRTIVLTYRDNTTIQDTFKVSHIHDQSVASSTWNITHNLNKNPSVSIVDVTNTEVIGEVEHINVNSLVVRFTAAFSGKAYLN